MILTLLYNFEFSRKPGKLAITHWKKNHYVSIIDKPITMRPWNFIDSVKNTYREVTRESLESFSLSVILATPLVWDSAIWNQSLWVFRIDPTSGRLISKNPMIIQFVPPLTTF